MANNHMGDLSHGIKIIRELKKITLKYNKFNILDSKKYIKIYMNEYIYSQIQESPSSIHPYLTYSFSNISSYNLHHSTQVH